MARKRANGEGTIRYVEKRNEYVGRIRDGVREDGKPNTVFFYSGKGGKRADVVKRMQEWRLAKQQGFVENNKTSLDACMKIWLETIKKPELKPASYDRLESTINNQIKPRIGNRDIKDLSDVVIKTELLDEMEKDGLSTSSMKKAYDAMHAYVRYAVYKGYLLRDPMGMMKPPKASLEVEAKGARVAEDKVDHLSDEEIVKLRTAAYSKWQTGKIRYQMGAAYVLILNTGLRMGEALALRWTDVDWKSKTLSVTKNLIVVKDRDERTATKQKMVIQNTPKSQKSRRVVPLNKEALNALMELKDRPYYSDEGYIIRTQEGNPILPRSFQQTLDMLAKVAGIRKIGIHALRHTYATKLFEAGIDVKIISELLGHSSTEITYRIYIHVIEELKREAVTKAFDIMPSGEINPSA